MPTNVVVFAPDPLSFAGIMRNQVRTFSISLTDDTGAPLSLTGVTLTLGLDNSGPGTMTTVGIDVPTATVSGRFSAGADKKVYFWYLRYQNSSTQEDYRIHTGKIPVDV